MIKDGKFGLQETIWLLVITSTAKVFFTSPAMVARIVGTAGWYMTLISALTAIVGFTFMYLLLKRFPGKNIMEIYDSVLGKITGFVFSFSFFFILLLTAAVNLREFVEVFKVYVYKSTPPLLLTSFLVATMIVMCWWGLEAIARYAKLVIYIMLVGFAGILILSIQNYQWHRLYPIWGYGLDRTVISGLARSSAYGDILIIGIIAKSMHGTKQIKKAGYLSLIFSGILVSISLLAFSLTFSYYSLREITSPMYLMTSLIDYGIFFQRLEPFFMFIWIISSLISTAVLLYMTMLVYSHIFSISDKKPIIIPLGIILAAISMIPQGIISLVKGYVQESRQYSWIFFFVPPLITFVIALVTKKRGRVENA